MQKQPRLIGTTFRLAVGLAVITVLAGAAVAAEPGRPDVARILERFDADKDGALTADELPERMQRRFKRLDRNSDGKLQREELERATAGKRRGRGGRPGEVNAKPAVEERHKDTLRVGDPAPDFTLPTPTGEEQVTLSDFQGKRPVVLMFGSYTCPPFRVRSQDVEKLYRTYQDRAQFLLVYIREAHPGSVLHTVKDGREVLEKIEQTETLEERRERAGQCVASLKLTLPAVVDRADNAVNRTYAGWPNRLVIVGTDGRLAYISGPGPGGFKPAEVEDWLKKNAPSPSE